jgi:hypothetical protein
MLTGYECVQAIQCDDMYLKAWQRRALARRENGDVHGCLSDLDMALQLSPGSAAISKELRVALAKELCSRGLRMPDALLTVRLEGLPEVQEAECTGMVSTSGSPVGSVNELTGPVDEDKQSKSRAATFVKHFGSKAGSSTVENGLLGAVAPDSMQTAVDSMFHACDTSPQNVAAHTDPTVTSWEENCPGSMASNQSTSADEPNKGCDAFGSCASPEFMETQRRSYERAADGKGAAQVDDLSANLWSSTYGQSVSGDEGEDRWMPPMTTIDFEQCWRRCKGDIRRQVSYLAVIDPKTLPQVFKSLLTPAVLEEIVGALLQEICCSSGMWGTLANRAAPSGACCVEMLQELQCVERFSMNTMLVPSKRRQALKQAWDAAEIALAGDPELLLALQNSRNAYRL